MQFRRTYNSLSAAQDGPLGFGWTHNYNMSVSTDATGAVTVTEDNGSTVPFTASGSTYQAPSRVLATLVANGDGTLTFTRQDQERFVFAVPSPGVPGQLLKEMDRNGYTTTLSYDGSGHLTTVTDPAGRTLTFTYNAAGRIGGIADPIGRSLSFAYDTSGNLTAVTDVAGDVTSFSYDGNHHMLTMTDPRGGIVTNAYDSNGRVIAQTDPMSRTTAFTYTLNTDGSQTTTITDPKGNVTTELYANNVLLSRTQGYSTPQAATWTYSYDPATLGVTAVTDPNGHTSYNTWDAHGNKLSSTDALSHTTTYTYDALNDLTSVTDPLSVTTVMTYDANGNLLASARPLTQTGQTALTTYSYDPAHPGDVIAQTDPNGHTSTFAYDAYGNRIRSSDALSHTTTYSYDLIGRMIATVSPSGNISVANPLSYTTTLAYDAFGDTTAITDSLGHRTTYQYDPNQNLSAMTDALGHITRYTYDADNELTGTNQPDGSTLASGYDADGNVISQTDALSRTTRYVYDPLNRVIAVTDPLSRTMMYGYDPAGNRTSLTDAMSRTTAYSYDAANELIGVTYSDGTTPNVAYTYTPDGQTATMTDGTGTTTNSYDSLNRLVDQVNGAGQSVGYGYDLQGNLTALTYPGGSQVTRGYDAANHLTAVSDWLNHTTRFAYDPNGNLIAQSYPNTTTAFLSYNTANQLTKIVDRRPSGAFWTFTYGRDALGQLSTSADPLDGLTHAYSYSPLNQLTVDRGIHGTTTRTATWSNDPAYEVTQMVKSSGPATSTLSYDVAAELTTFHTIKGGTTTQNVALGYNADGDRSVQHDSVTGTGGDAGFDQADRMITVTVSTKVGITSTAYAYDGTGLRMSKTVSGTVESFTWDTAEGVPLLLQDGTTRYVTGPDGLPLEQVAASGAVLYYYHDQLGSTRGLLNGAGKIAATYTYDPYGSVTAGTGTATNPFGYAGQYADNETGLLYLRARYYDPRTAQFTTRDPLQSLTWQPFAYTGNDPINLIDVTGLMADLCTLTIKPYGIGLAFGPSGIAGSSAALVPSPGRSQQLVVDDTSPPTQQDLQTDGQIMSVLSCGEQILARSPGLTVPCASVLVGAANAAMSYVIPPPAYSQ